MSPQESGLVTFRHRVTGAVRKARYVYGVQWVGYVFDDDPRTLVTAATVDREYEVMWSGGFLSTEVNS